MSKRAGKVFYLVAGLVVAAGMVAVAKIPPQFSLMPEAHAESASQDEALFWQLVHEDFDQWDSNHDGKLDNDDVDAAIQLPSIKGDHAAALSAIKVFFRGEAKKDEGIGELSQAELYPADSSGQETKLAKKLVSLFKAYRKKIANESPQLYADGQPHIDTIHQGRTSDCYFLATLGGLAYHDPQRLMSLIVTNSDKTYTVTFPNQEPVVVPAPTDCEIACYSDAGADGYWVHVLEKAYAVYKNRKVGKAEALDNFTHGGSGGKAISFVTGHPYKRYPTDKTNDLVMRQYLSAAMSRNKVVNTGTTGHCLTVLSFDPGTDMITIWNPWGSSTFYKAAGVKMNHGVFTLPFNDFEHRFVSLLVEGD